jgi:hypothetical protein
MNSDSLVNSRFWILSRKQRKHYISSKYNFLTHITFFLLCSGKHFWFAGKSNFSSTLYYIFKSYISIHIGMLTTKNRQIS